MRLLISAFVLQKRVPKLSTCCNLLLESRAYVNIKHLRTWEADEKVLKKLYTGYEGIFGYYKGLWPNLLRVTPTCAITFFVYESIITTLTPKVNRGGL